MRLRAFNVLPGMVLTVAGEHRLAIVEHVRRDSEAEEVTLEGHLAHYYSVGRLVGPQEWTQKFNFNQQLDFVGATPYPWERTENDYGTLFCDIYADGNDRVMECHEQMEVIHPDEELPDGVVPLSEIMADVKATFEAEGWKEV